MVLAETKRPFPRNSTATVRTECIATPHKYLEKFSRFAYPSPSLAATFTGRDPFLIMDADECYSSHSSSEEQRKAHVIESEAFLTHDCPRRPSRVKRLATAPNLLVANLIVFLASITTLLTAHHTCPSRYCSSEAKLSSRTNF